MDSSIQKSTSPEKKLSSLSIFFPCYNDAGTIASIVALAYITARKLTEDFEVIVVDDGSTDAGLEILDELERLYPNLQVIRHEQNRGYGGALKTGFAASSKVFVFYTDGDIQYDVSELACLAEQMQDGVDLVNGYKIRRSDSLWRKIIGYSYNAFARFAFGIRLRDIDCDFRLIRRSVFDKVRLYSDTGVICVEMTKKIQENGFTFREVPVTHHFRSYGRSQFFTPAHVFRSLVAITRLWWDMIVMQRV